MSVDRRGRAALSGTMADWYPVYPNVSVTFCSSYNTCSCGDPVLARRKHQTWTSYAACSFERAWCGKQRLALNPVPPWNKWYDQAAVWSVMTDDFAKWLQGYGGPCDTTLVPFDVALGSYDKRDNAMPYRDWCMQGKRGCLL